MASGKPNQKIMWVWRIRLFGLAFLCAFGSSLLFSKNRTWYLICTAVWVCAFLLMYVLYYPIKYHRLRYCLENDWLVISCGVIYNRIKAIPLQNIQYVTVSSLPLPRLLGLATVLVHAAGGTLFIPGLKTPQAQALRKLLTQWAMGEKGGE